MCDTIINEHVSIREAVILTGMCAQTLRKLGDQQKIKCYKTHSGQRKFDKASLIEMVKSNSTLSNIVNKVSKNNCIKDENTDNNVEGNPSMNINKEFFYYDICNYKIEKKIIDEFISKKSSITIINDIDKIIDICLESKNINIYILPALFNNKNEYIMLKRICDKYNNNVIII
uniref:Helix-turn-helix domain-containing protein n=1 Tax=viral metagenome TaxID=1070528 RepID=A0A6C0J0H9_9ZZZZ